MMFVVILAVEVVLEVQVEPQAAVVLPNILQVVADTYINVN